MNYTTCPVYDCCGGTIIRDNGMRAKCRNCSGRGVVEAPRVTTTHDSPPVMTTRAQLESERDALRTTLGRLECGPLNHKHAERDALTASIARVEALLSLSDEQAGCVRTSLDVRSSMVKDPDLARAYVTVADIVRRS